MARVVILGSGLTGLSSAYHLEQSGFLDYKIFERDNVPGGLCKSVKQDGFIFDYTGHFIHINDPYFKNFIEKILGFQSLSCITRKSFIYSNNVFTKYPFQTNLNGLPADVIADCIEGFIKRKNISNPKNFYEWVLKYFGKGIGKHFLFPYQSKIFSYDIKKVNPSWTGRFVPSTDLRTIIHGAVNTEDKKVGYNSTFYYPKAGGIYHLPNKIASTLNNKIHTGYDAISIDTKKKLIFFSNDHVESYEQLITTIPLDNLINISNFKSSFSLKKVSGKLLCNSVFNFNLGLNTKDLTDKHWVYFPEKKYSFYRIGFWSNFSSNMSPSGTSMYGEFSYFNQSEAQLKKRSDKSIKQVLSLFGLSKDNIILQRNLLLKHAYVIYDDWYMENIKKIHSALNKNLIYSVGRFGAWKYSSMQEAILDGKNIASTVLSKSKVWFNGVLKTEIDKSSTNKLIRDIKNEKRVNI